MVDLREEPAIRRTTIATADTCCRIVERGGLCATRIIAAEGRQSAVARVLGHGLPELPNSALEIGGGTLFWLRPRDWLLARHDPAGRRGGFAVDLRRRLDGIALAIDQSHGLVVLRLTGPATRPILQKGIDIDLHAEVFGPGVAAQTGLAGMAVLVHAVAEGTFDLYGCRSYCESLLDWLLEAGREWNIVMEAPEP